MSFCHPQTSTKHSVVMDIHIHVWFFYWHGKHTHTYYIQGVQWIGASIRIIFNPAFSQLPTRWSWREKRRKKNISKLHRTPLPVCWRCSRCVVCDDRHIVPPYNRHATFATTYYIKSAHKYKRIKSKSKDIAPTKNMCGSVLFRLFFRLFVNTSHWRWWWWRWWQWWWWPSRRSVVVAVVPGLVAISGSERQHEQVRRHEKDATE